MLQVGLTGNIAVGKSHASCVLAELGAHVIDADEIVHELFLPGSATRDKVVSAYGAQILGADQSIDRRILGAIVFHSPEQRMLLNAIVHPDVVAEIMRRTFVLAKADFGGVIVTDAALLIESGFYRTQDRLIVVYCDPALQLSRVMSRYGLGAEDARLRIEAQMPTEEKIKLAHYTIDTSGTYSSTRDQVERIYRDLMRCVQEHRTLDSQGAS